MVWNEFVITPRTFHGGVAPDNLTRAPWWGHARLFPSPDLAPGQLSCRVRAGRGPIFARASHRVHGPFTGPDCGNLSAARLCLAGAGGQVSPRRHEDGDARPGPSLHRWPRPPGGPCAEDGTTSGDPWAARPNLVRSSTDVLWWPGSNAGGYRLAWHSEPGRSLAIASLPRIKRCKDMRCPRASTDFACRSLNSPDLCLWHGMLRGRLRRRSLWPRVSAAPARHITNTTAELRRPGAQGSLVRRGIQRTRFPGLQMRGWGDMYNAPASTPRSSLSLAGQSCEDVLSETAAFVRGGEVSSAPKRTEKAVPRSHGNA